MYRFGPILGQIPFTTSAIATELCSILSQDSAITDAIQNNSARLPPPSERAYLLLQKKLCVSAALHETLSSILAQSKQYYVSKSPRCHRNNNLAQRASVTQPQVADAEGYLGIDITSSPQR